MELGGTWRAASADEALRRAFPAADFDDGGWEPVVVPGHWRSTPAFADAGGPLLYRRSFDAPAPGEGRRSWLTLDGVFQDGDVWLDGSYVGPTEGYFFPHTFEVTDALTQRSGHVLAVEVGCSPQPDPFLDPAWNPGGIWRPVRLTETGPVRISSLRVLCAEASAERAVLSVHADLDTLHADAIRLRIRTGDIEQVTEHTLAHGVNRIRERLVVENPALWWPHALGDQPLHHVSVEVLTDTGDDVSDARRVRTGLREVRMKRSVLTVNGERLFVKGSNHGPTRRALAEATPDELERDVTLAREAGLDLLRLYAHVTRPELYEAADDQGLLLWQDLPLQWGYARSVRRRAARQAREAVDLLGHHPSVAVWCGHTGAPALDVEPEKTSVSLAVRLVARQAVPTWNATLERADPTRPVIAGTHPELYCGWYHGDERDFPRILATVPRLASFVTEFGAQAAPETAGWMHPERWRGLDWDGLAAHHALQPAAFERYVPPAAHPTFEGWRAASQAYQADVIRFQIETLRRLKYRPTGGFCQFCFADAQPAVSWSVLDHERRPKAGYAALAAACAPVVVIADRPRASYQSGEEIRLDVHAVSDLRRPLTGLRVTARLGLFSTGWEGEVAADGVTRIGTIRTNAPAIPGTHTVELELAGDGVRVTNSYPLLVVPRDWVRGGT
jgi:beta-mannosidase